MIGAWHIFAALVGGAVGGIGYRVCRDLYLGCSIDGLRRSLAVAKGQLSELEHVRRQRDEARKTATLMRTERDERVNDLRAASKLLAAVADGKIRHVTCIGESA